MAVVPRLLFDSGRGRHRTYVLSGRLVCQSKNGVKNGFVDSFQVDRPIFPWIVKHAVWVLNRSLIHNDGRSSSHTRHGKGPLPGLAEFGEKVFFKAHGKHCTAKAESSFNPGFWMGKKPILESTLSERLQASSKPGPPSECSLRREMDRSTRCCVSCRSASRSTADNRRPRSVGGDA